VSVTSAFWRRLAYAGARYGPTPWVRYSPPFFGLAFALALPEKRAVVRRNLRRMLGQRPTAVEELDVLKTFVAYSHCLAESLAVERPEARVACHHVYGEDTLLEVLEEGRGAILVTAHSGAWDVTAYLLSQKTKSEIVVAMSAENDAAARRLHDSVRRRGGVRVVHVGKHPLDAMPLLRHLKRGGMVAMQLDRPGPSERLAVDLFGQPFYVPRGPFHLSGLSQAPIIPIFTQRFGYFAYEVVMGSPVQVARRGGQEEVRRAAQSAVREMEGFLRANPTQWFHFEA
jgi:lauroyl/myristoyl acyltransferase